MTVQIQPMALSSDPGAIDTIYVTINSAGAEISAFELTFGYDTDEFEIFDAKPGDFLQRCGWEYFTFRTDLKCDGPCPTGTIKVVSLARMQTTDTSKICFLPEPGATLVRLLVRRNPVPFTPIADQSVRFLWIDCGDNSLSSVSGDVLWLGENEISVNDSGDTTITSQESFPNFSGPTGECTKDSGVNAPVQRIRFVDGLISAPEIDIVPQTDSAVDTTASKR